MYAGGGGLVRNGETAETVPMQGRRSRTKKVIRRP